MAEFDLTHLSETELRDLANRIESELEKRASQKKKVVLDQIKELAQSIGLTVNQIVAAERKGIKKTKIAAATMYANPDNDTRGDWRTSDLTLGYSWKERPNLYYPLLDPVTEIV